MQTIPPLRFDETNENVENSSIKVGVAIPTYNEKVNLQPLIERLSKVFRDNKIRSHIVIVDDKSTDGTGNLADNLAQKYGNISVIHRPGKLGLGSAYKDAFQFLLNDPEVTVVMEMDADLSHEPEYIPSLLSKIEEGFDVVVGSRYIAEGGVDEEWAPMRRLISKSANFMTKLLVGLNVKDATSGFRAYESYALKSIDLSKVRTNGYAFQIDMLFHCRNVGCEIGEAPIIFKERRHGASKLGRLAILEFVKTLENSFVARISSMILYAGQFTSVWLSNAFWIGIKPLRTAIREANSLCVNNSSLAEQNSVYVKNQKILNGDFDDCGKCFNKF
jgi:dolichol-phosphate mannosyltransferase